jgi:hypothetical protein
MTNNTFDFVMEQGSTFRMVFLIKDANNEVFDLNNYTAEMMFRKAYGSSTPVITATTSNGKLSILVIAGQITLELEPEDTIGIRFSNRDDESIDLVYDLEIIDSITGDVYKPVRGTATLVREVTRND